jgi:hypothetical protein
VKYPEFRGALFAPEIPDEHPGDPEYLAFIMTATTFYRLRCHIPGQTSAEVVATDKKSNRQVRMLVIPKRARVKPEFRQR